MAQLAIKGHETRGNEVIEILEMLGGINKIEYTGKNKESVYYFTNDNYIDWCHDYYPESIFISFTLEEFLKKYPYKVGDKVSVLKGSNYIFTIKSMTWDTDHEEVLYRIEAIDDIENEFDWHADELIYYSEQKEETMDKTSKTVFDVNSQCCDIRNDIIKKDMEEIKVDIPKGYEFAGIDDNKQQVVFAKIGYHYPKTYEECCEVLGIRSDWHLTFELNNSASCGLCINKEFEYICKLEAFRKLLICRDAYWKIAGEQMVLSEPWKPDWNNDSQFKYIITCRRGNIIKDTYTAKNCILAFPSKEMRDVFFENFKKLIEECKELL